jgi:lysyl-tRNA synthetase class 1
MSRKIIGHGTWYDKTATRIVERERKMGRSLDLIRTESGLGASGFPHIGSLGDAARSHAVTLALKEQGYRSELIAFCDDKDGLRKVPAGLPETLEKYLGFPVSSIPDPFGCHESYGRHMSSLLLDALDNCGITYHYMSAKEVHEKGILNEETKTLLLNAERVGEIVKEEVGQERYTEVLPYFPICSSCGRIYTTKALEFLPDENRVVYSCEGMEIKGRWIDGCGFRGEADVEKGEGKLSWKGEFAARWKALDIRFEAYGKDIADSVRINDRICREILAFEPPSHAMYEMFLDKSGKKISKSTGNVFTPQVWFRYGSPQSLSLLMLKRFVGTRTLDVTDIPTYMNEMDHLEDVYFGRKPVKEDRELAKLKGLYEYSWMLKPPEKPGVHVPYNLMIFLVKMAPKDGRENFVAEKLRSYGYLQKNQTLDEELKKRIQYTLNWIEDFAEVKETAISLTGQQRQAITELIKVLSGSVDAEKIQNSVFSIAKDSNLQPVEFFKILYMILVGAPHGPRLGTYMLEMGKQNVIKTLKNAISQDQSSIDKTD